ncbi:signal transduction histidine kinase [Archangium gephyra]|uniref:histidine kinase n=1 Tax=Archangium gephyra TaxID=48 RepID=A0AAC8TDQ9_9BACT|nr:ATP-binding protein [Archangium gephyra]AKJ02082.1 Chemotaxis protein methyltransferase CheR [Archangium gephyra]REG28987.1 signal transduction histidine kinase [Archangium gephyra]
MPKTDPSAPCVSDSQDSCLAEGGELGTLVRSVDWSKTPLGPVSGWPTSLKTMVGVVLRNRFPMLLWWGPDLIQIYNDGYRPILGEKHPASLGAPAIQVWSEIWDVIGPMARSVLDGAPATWNESFLLLINRRGFPEETYHTFSYSPVPAEGGQVGGVLVTVQETTGQEQDNRQLRMLGELAARAADAKSAEQACRTATGILADNDADLPFSLFYLLSEDARELRLVSTTGLERYEGPGKPGQVPFDASASDTGGWPFAEAARTGREALVDNLSERFGAMPGGRWGIPSERAVVLPLSRPGQPHPYGFLVAGVSPRRVLDDRYLGLFRLTADQVVTAIANASAYEEERKRVEALAEIDRAKTAFFSNVSHEFRTPLTLMLGPTEDALASPSQALTGGNLETVHRNALRLLKLVNSLLDFARIEAGRIQATYTPVDLAELTTGLASAFRSAIERAGLTFEVSCPPLPEPLYVDQDMWEKIVLNLLSNALKFTFEGAIHVSQRWLGEGVELQVTDTGTGIPESELPHLFERFHRVQGARSRTHEGSGIGLALVHELVRMHGGTITATSTAGQGTTFTVRVPAGTAHLPKERVAARRSQESTALGTAPYVNEALRWLPGAPEVPSVEPSRLSAPVHPVMDIVAGARILLADDNADMREYVGRLLAERWRVETAPDGLAALEAARARPPDLVLTDVMMPGLDGFGLLRELRADERTRNVPVIVLSARAGEEAHVEGLRAGANDYLVKPFSARELVARVESQLVRARLRTVEEEHHRRLARVFQHAPVGVAVMRGPEHVIEYLNAGYLQLFSKRPVLGRSVREALPELANQGIYELLDGVFTSGEPYIGRSVRVLLNRGSAEVLEECFFDFVYQPMLDEAGQVEGIVAVAFDVTELANARRGAESANRAKDEFLAMLGHELRNPLAPILTALQLMQLRGDGELERERTLIERQVKHLVRLVDDLLDVSRVTRGKVELKREKLELSTVVAKALEQASPLIEQREHTLTVDVPRQGLRLDADPTRLAQVFSNLLTNAAKYTEPGGRISVRAMREGQEAVIRVRDNGTGIDPETLPRVFNLFVQERQALDRSQGGLGLGLAIVRSMVTLHGGSVEVYSEGRGRGSEFTVRLPLLEAEEARAVAAPVQAEPVPPARDAVPGRVLVVDDNRDAADILSETLELLGCQTQVAYDGPSALRMAETFQPEVALLDIGLPVMDGYELARLLRQRYADRGIRLIAVTGYGQASDRQQSKEAGFDAHLVKPLDLDVLESLLKRLAAS